MTEVSRYLRNIFYSSSFIHHHSSSSFQPMRGKSRQGTWLSAHELSFWFWFFLLLFFSFSFSSFLGVHGFYTERARLAGVELQHSTCKTEYESGGYAFSLFFSFSICIFNVFYFSFSFSFFVFSFFFLFQVYTASAYTASTQNVQDQLGQNSSVHGFRAHGFHTERARLAGVEKVYSASAHTASTLNVQDQLGQNRCSWLPHTRLPRRTCKTSQSGISAQHVQDQSALSIYKLIMTKVSRNLRNILFNQNTPDFKT